MRPPEQGINFEGADFMAHKYSVNPILRPLGPLPAGLIFSRQISNNPEKTYNAAMATQLGSKSLNPLNNSSDAHAAAYT